MRILSLFQSPKPPNYDDEKTHRVEALLNSYASPGTIVELGFPDEVDDGGIYEAVGGQRALNPLRHILRAPGMVQKTLWAEQNGYDAVVQSNTFDPAIDGGRLSVKIPVIGPMRTAVHVGLIFSDRIGIIVPLPTHRAYTQRILRSYGLEGSIVGIENLSAGSFPEGIYGARLTKLNTDKIVEEMILIMRRLVIERGAEMILPLGGAVVPHLVDPRELERLSGIPVLNSEAIAIKFAEMSVNLGLTQSPLTYRRWNDQLSF